MNALHALQTLAVSIRSVRKVYGDPHSGPVALKNIDLDIRDNEFFTLLGPSGCGKTTLLRMIAGFEFPTQGEILLYGENIADRPPFERPVNTVFQHYALFPHMTLAENLAFGLESRPMGQVLSKAQIAERVREMLALVQMERFAARKPNQLSGGQQQRIALARALAPHPKVLLLDEPLSALDASVRGHLRDQIRALQQRFGATTLLVTHDQEEALTMADRVAVLKEGRLLQMATPRELYERPAQRAVAEFVGLSTLLTGKVAAPGRVDVGFAQLATPTGSRPVGQAVHVLVRPEHVQADPAPGAPNRLEGRPGAARYLGAMTRYDFEVAGAPRPFLAEGRRSATTAIAIAPESIRLLDD